MLSLDQYESSFSSWNSYRKLIVLLDRENVIIQTLEILKKLDLRPRHWKYVEESVEWNFDPMSTTFNINNLLINDFDKKTDRILKAVELCKKEEEIATELKGIERSMRSIKFIETPKRINELHSIDNFDSELAKIDSYILTISNLTKLEATMYFKSEILRIENNLILMKEYIIWSKKFQNSVLDIVNCQKTLGREDEFSSQIEINDIRTFFNQNIKSLLTNTAPFYQNVNTWNSELVAISEGLLVKAYSSLENLLFNYRLKCPNFFFIDDQTLIKFLRHFDSDISSISKYAHLLFDGAASFVIEDDIVQNTSEISGIQTKCGQILSFVSKLKTTNAQLDKKVRFVLNSIDIIKEHTEIINAFTKSIYSENLDPMIALAANRLNVNAKNIEYGIKSSTNFICCHHIDEGNIEITLPYNFFEMNIEMPDLQKLLEVRLYTLKFENFHEQARDSNIFIKQICSEFGENNIIRKPFSLINKLWKIIEKNMTLYLNSKEEKIILLAIREIFCSKLDSEARKIYDLIEKESILSKSYEIRKDVNSSHNYQSSDQENFKKIIQSLFLDDSGDILTEINFEISDREALDFEYFDNYVHGFELDLSVISDKIFE
ncbi:MAG: Dynein heavy chain 10, axonemal [Marteilia pararefringens]